MEIEYENFSFPERYFGKVIEALKRDEDVIGFNVTMPYKVKMVDYVKGDYDVSVCGAVNCVKIAGKERILMGFNTDWHGIYNPLSYSGVNNGVCCMAGAGGAARSAVYACTNMKFDEIHIFNRSRERVLELKKTFDSIVAHDISELDEYLRIFGCDVLINTTSVGMVPNTEECLPIGLSALKNVSTVFDAVYKPCRTKLLKMAEESGCEIIYGIEMLYEQHIENIKIWDIPKKDKVLNAITNLKKEEMESIREDK